MQKNMIKEQYIIVFTKRYLVINDFTQYITMLLLFKNPFIMNYSISKLTFH